MNTPPCKPVTVSQFPALLWPTVFLFMIIIIIIINDHSIISFSKEDARDIDQLYHDAGCDSMAFAVNLNDDTQLASIGTLNLSLRFSLPSLFVNNCIIPPSSGIKKIGHRQMILKGIQLYLAVDQVGQPASAKPGPVITYDDLATGTVKRGVAILVQFQDFSLAAKHQGLTPAKWKIYPELPRGITLHEKDGTISGKCMESIGMCNHLEPGSIGSKSCSVSIRFSIFLLLYLQINQCTRNAPSSTRDGVLHHHCDLSAWSAVRYHKLGPFIPLLVSQLSFCFLEQMLCRCSN